MVHIVNGKRQPLCGVDKRRAKRVVRSLQPGGIPTGVCLSCALHHLGIATSVALRVQGARR